MKPGLVPVLACALVLAACGSDTSKRTGDDSRGAPIAAFTASPTVGAAPLTVTLDASASTDPNQDDSTLRFSWDVDGDGTWDSVESPALRQHTVTYSDPGSFRIGLRVIDDTDLEATAHADLTVLPASDLLADIDADSNRDGVITVLDDDGEELWSADGGAVLPVNWDDDDDNVSRDGSDDAVNGTADLDDMAPIIVRQVPALTGAQQVEIEIGPPVAAGYLRLFSEEGLAVLHAPGDGTAALDPTVLAAGDLALRLEAVTGRSQVWDGSLSLTLRISSGGAVVSEDVVALRAAPLIFTDNTRAAEVLYIMHITAMADAPNQEFYQAMVDGIPETVTVREADPYQYDVDRWLQDNMQSGYQAVPAAGGARIIPTYLQAWRSRGFTWRPVGLAEYLTGELIGPDHGFAYPCVNGDCADSSLNYGGNIEVAPPHSTGSADFPLGRVVIGGGDAGTVYDTTAWHYHMAEGQASWIDAQEVQGPALEISSEWLAVGHVDEFFLFVPDLVASNGRPWKVVLASTVLAREALRPLYLGSGGSLPVFDGRLTETTVADIFEDTELMAFNQLVQARIDSVRAVLASELGLAEDDFVEVPVLYEEYVEFTGATEMAVAYSPGLTNLVVVDDTFFVPDPEGPVDGGEDVWKTETTAALEALGVQVVYVDVFESYHLLMGEAHCGTNVAGAAYDTPWWQL